MTDEQRTNPPWVECPTCNPLSSSAAYCEAHVPPRYGPPTPSGKLAYPEEASDVAFLRDFIGRIETRYEEWAGEGPPPSLSVDYETLRRRIRDLRMGQGKTTELPAASAAGMLPRGAAGSEGRGSGKGAPSGNGPDQTDSALLTSEPLPTCEQLWRMASGSRPSEQFQDAFLRLWDRARAAEALGAELERRTANPSGNYVCVACAVLAHSRCDARGCRCDCAIARGYEPPMAEGKTKP